jgi:hypothetical protein
MAHQAERLAIYCTVFLLGDHIANRKMIPKLVGYLWTGWMDRYPYLEKLKVISGSDVESWIHGQLVQPQITDTHRSTKQSYLT